MSRSLLGNWSHVMIEVAVCAMLCVFCIPANCAGNEMQSGNVVGYRNADHKRGVHVNTLTSVDGDDTRIGDVVHCECEGTELRFNDGQEWRRVRSAMGDDNRIHWFDADSNFCADDYTIPIGAAIQYQVPESSESGLTFSGQVPESFLDGDIGPLFTDGPALNEIRLRPEEVMRIMGYARQTVTNRVFVTNVPPSRFLVRMKDNTIRHAKYDYSRMGIVDMQTGKEILVGSDMVLCFEVETNRDVAVSARLSERQVEELQKAYVREYRQAKDAKEQENAAKGIEAAIFGINAIWKWLVGSVGAVLVGLIVTALWQYAILQLRNLKKRFGLIVIRIKGRRLYRKTMKERERAMRRSS